MTDTNRSDEIRARLAAYLGWHDEWDAKAVEDFQSNAPDDIAWLLAEDERHMALIEQQADENDRLQMELDRLRAVAAQLAEALKAWVDWYPDAFDPQNMLEQHLDALAAYRQTQEEQTPMRDETDTYTSWNEWGDA